MSHLRRKTSSSVVEGKTAGDDRLQYNTEEPMGETFHQLQTDRPRTYEGESDTEERFVYSRQTSLEEVEPTIDELAGDPETELVSQSPTAIAEVAGVKIGCVLDTGAEASIIPSDVLSQHLSLWVVVTKKVTFVTIRYSDSILVFYPLFQTM